MFEYIIKIIVFDLKVLVCILVIVADLYIMSVILVNFCIQYEYFVDRCLSDG